jgi:hypothetical protein
MLNLTLMLATFAFNDSANLDGAVAKLVKHDSASDWRYNSSLHQRLKVSAHRRFLLQKPAKEAKLSTTKTAAATQALRRLTVPIRGSTPEEMEFHWREQARNELVEGLAADRRDGEALALAEEIWLDAQKDTRAPSAAQRVWALLMLTGDVDGAAQFLGSCVQQHPEWLGMEEVKNLVATTVLFYYPDDRECLEHVNSLSMDHFGDRDWLGTSKTKAEEARSRALLLLIYRQQGSLFRLVASRIALRMDPGNFLAAQALAGYYGDRERFVDALRVYRGVLPWLSDPNRRAEVEHSISLLEKL